MADARDWKVFISSPVSGLEEYRAAAANAYGSGADGVYLFNFPCNDELCFQIPVPVDRKPFPAPEFTPPAFHAPLTRARYSGFLRNVAVAMGNARHERLRAPLERLAASEDAVVAGHARWALGRLGG